MIFLSREQFDKFLKLAYDEGKDLHTVCAAKMFSVTESAVTPEQRNFSKEYNFAYCYGGVMKIFTNPLKQGLG